ncbi:hypothetical protein EW145_g6564 [Phellinidium pouzarii]|uniref:Uncharacterized protein n=1 Tax=Phellinidium pouzarii TaxID=167371 RepID=A0A4S4KWQ9_9AGAM|nr:hypothetical protein EW145_g6564 [Phellinidium pouzarii]
MRAPSMRRRKTAPLPTLITNKLLKVKDEADDTIYDHLKDLGRRQNVEIDEIKQFSIALRHESSSDASTNADEEQPQSSRADQGMNNKGKGKQPASDLVHPDEDVTSSISTGPLPSQTKEEQPVATKPPALRRSTRRAAAVTREKMRGGSHWSCTSERQRKVTSRRETSTPRKALARKNTQKEVKPPKAPRKNSAEEGEKKRARDDIEDEDEPAPADKEPEEKRAKLLATATTEDINSAENAVATSSRVRAEDLPELASDEEENFELAIAAPSVAEPPVAPEPTVLTLPTEPAPAPARPLRWPCQLSLRQYSLHM